MLTLKELRKITDVPKDSAKLPTAKQLRATGMLIVKEQLGQEAEVSAYQNGCVLYQVGKHSAVFFLHLCREYLYLSGRETFHLPQQFFEDERWYLRLVLEGEDRLNRNYEERERNWNVPYSAASEKWLAIKDVPGIETEYLAGQEAMEEIMQALTERQKTVIYGYYIQGKTQKQIAEELGVSRLAVRDSLCRAANRIRKRCSFSCLSLCHEAAYGEGTA